MGHSTEAPRARRFVPHGEGEAMPFVSAEVDTFTDDRISRIQTYQPMS